MICPGCGENLLISQLVKTNVRGFKNVDIVYDALCPVCRTEIGRMFWGEMILNQPEAAAEPHAHGEQAEPQDADTKYYICPHCHGPLPGDIRLLQVKRQPQDRRIRDRRDGEDRRKRQVRFFGVDRRKGQRRKGERRTGIDRRAAAAHGDTLRGDALEAANTAPATAETAPSVKMPRPALLDLLKVDPGED